MSGLPSTPLTARPEVERLRAYRLPQAAEVKLNQNESGEDWPADLKAEVVRALLALPWNRYPPVDARPLREDLARAAGVSADMIAVTNGSNEALLALIEAFACGRTVVTTAPGYSMTPTLAIIGGATVAPILLRPDFSLDVDAMRTAVMRPDVTLTVIASPNNPTGNRFARSDIEALLAAAAGPVVIDEAYGEFAADSFVPDVGRYPHLVVLRTFSKACGFAGGRVGWLVGCEPVVASVRKTLPPYNVNIFAQEAARAALRRTDLVAARVRRIANERRRLEAELRALGVVEVFTTETNFLLIRTPYDGSGLMASLLRRGVLVRDVSGMPLLDRCLRVTVGTSEEGNRFLAALREALEEPS